jgi:hypothetical protein
MQLYGPVPTALLKHQSLASAAAAAAAAAM